MKKHLLLISTASLLAVVGAHAQTQRVFHNDAGTGDQLWNNNANWTATSGGVFANSVDEWVQLNANPIVNGNYTISRIQSNFGAGADQTVSGSGILTINAQEGNDNGILNNSNNGINMRFTGNVTINHGNNGISNFAFANSNNNAITFETGSSLELTTRIETATGTAGRALNFNGAITGGSANVGGIRIGANSHNINFGATADNTGYAGDIVFFANGQVVSETTVAGGFVRAGSKIQVNGDNATLALNGAGGLEGNVVISADRVFNLEVNADQSNVGFVNLSNGSELNIILGGSVSELAFASSASIGWGTGQISITGFRENTIRFGSNDTGLTSSQLDQIDGGIYFLTDQGFLSIPEPRTYALLFGVFGLGFALFRRRRS